MTESATATSTLYQTYLYADYIPGVSILSSCFKLFQKGIIDLTGYQPTKNEPILKHVSEQSYGRYIALIFFPVGANVVVAALDYIDSSDSYFVDETGESDVYKELTYSKHQARCKKAAYDESDYSSDPGSESDYLPTEGDMTLRGGKEEWSFRIDSDEECANDYKVENEVSSDEDISFDTTKIPSPDVAMEELSSGWFYPTYGTFNWSNHSSNETSPFETPLRKQDENSPTRNSSSPTRRKLFKDDYEMQEQKLSDEEGSETTADLGSSTDTMDSLASSSPKNVLKTGSPFSTLKRESPYPAAEVTQNPKRVHFKGSDSDESGKDDFSLGSLLEDKEYIALQNNLFFSPQKSVVQFRKEIELREKNEQIQIVEELNQIKHFVDKLIDGIRTQPPRYAEEELSDIKKDMFQLREKLKAYRQTAKPHGKEKTIMGLIDSIEEKTFEI